MAKNKKNFPEKEERDPLALFIKKSNDWVQEYSKAAFIALFIGLASFGSFLLFAYWQKQTNRASEESLYTARQELVSAEAKAGGDILGFDSSQNFFGQSKKAKYDSSVDKPAKEYVSLIKKWIKKPAGLTAASEISHFFYQYDKKEEAIELLKEAGSYKRKNLTGFLIAFQLGTYLMDRNEYDSAVKEFQFITLSEKAKWLWPDALIRTALCYERQNKLDEAKKIYKQIKNDFSDSQAGMKSMQYLNLLQIQNKIKTASNSQKVQEVEKKMDDQLSEALMKEKTTDTDSSLKVKEEPEIKNSKPGE